jgi:glycosyltransferase involved in cell wall biosynthesis
MVCKNEPLEDKIPLKKIVFIITGLTTGGAEMMLLKLCSQIDKSRFSLSVISLRDSGNIGPRIEKLGIPVYSLGFRSSLLFIPLIIKLRKLLYELKPDLIQGWMYHGNLVASLFTGKALVCWGIRSSLLDFNEIGGMSRWIIKIGKYLSHFPNCIIYNSNVSSRQHLEFGYFGGRAIVIPNGFDIGVMKPDENAYFLIRNEIGISGNVVLIGLVARFHPMKDHEIFLKAAELLLRELPDVYFMLVGSGVSKENAKLSDMITTLGLCDKVLLCGERSDIPKITAALDIATSCSAWGEGFANSIGEAMSCGVPCVVTDVGDSAWIVGETGRVVPPGDPNALAAAWKSLIAIGSDKRHALGLLARKRIRNNFSLDTVARQYEDIYFKLIK